MIEKIIMVTGAPRSGTTPVGQILKMLSGTIDLYEPMGPTGDRRFSRPFPMPGEDDWTADQCSGFIRDLARLKLDLKPQIRPGIRGPMAVLRMLVGTRTLMSYRAARLTPRKRILIWKDPHAVFWAPMADQALFRAIVTVRPPHAHAASFKRLGWVSPVEQIYPRYRARYGPIGDVESVLDRYGHTPVGSASILWRMIYERVHQVFVNRRKSSLYLLNMQTLASDENAAYEQLFQWIGEPMPERTRLLVAARASGVSAKTPSVGRVHSWNRSASQANTYWSEVLDSDEIEFVDRMNHKLWQMLNSLGPLA